METNPIYCSRLRLFICVCLCLVLSLTARSQQPPVPRRYIPPELQASDQEIRKLLTAAESKSEAGEYESAFADSRAALELAEKKGLVGDRAIAEESVASGYFASGKLDESLKLYQASLQACDRFLQPRPSGRCVSRPFSLAPAPRQFARSITAFGQSARAGQPKQEPIHKGSCIRRTGKTPNSFWPNRARS